MTGEHTSERGGEISRRRYAIARTSRIPLKREILHDNRKITTHALREQFVAENRSLRTGKTADFHGITGTLATVRDSRGTEETVIDCRERGELPMPPSCRRCANRLQKW